MAWTAAGQVRENMTFGTALPTAPPSGTAKCPVGRVRLGVFFDGTNNNAWRDWGKGFADWKPGSSEPAPDVDHLRGPDPGTKVELDELNGPTNVAKLYYLFKEEGCCQKRIYATGVGGGAQDMPPGEMHTDEAASGLGGRARIDWGIAWVTEFVNRDNHHLAVEKRIDTFGFSRGATQARDFINKVLAARIENRSMPPTGHRFEARFVPSVMDYENSVKIVYVKVDTYPEMRGILFEYMGIMDTVASMGLGTIFQAGDSIAGYTLAVLGRPKQVDKKPEDILHVPSTPQNVVDKEGWVHQTLHQVADDEWRDVFALEALGNDPKPGDRRRSYKHLPKNMREMSYPGCHADIGGGYRNTAGKDGTPDREEKVWDRSGWHTIIIPGKPPVPPKFMNISTLTLGDMIKDAQKAGVPLHDLSALPAGLNKVDSDRAPELSALYDQYCSERAGLVMKHARDLPKYADWTHDIVHDPVYIQSYPDPIYQAIAEDLHKSGAYRQLATHYIHDSETIEYRVIDAVRRRARRWFAEKVRNVSRFVDDPVLRPNERDLNTGAFDTKRQRDVHYHGFQNSYDEPDCDNGKSQP